MAVALDANLGTVTQHIVTAPVTLTASLSAAAAGTKLVVIGSWWDSSAGGTAALSSISDNGTGGGAGNWSFIQGAHTNGQDALFIAYRDAASGLALNANFTITFSATVEGGFLASAHSFSGVATGAHEAAGTTNSTSGTSISSGSVTTLSDGALVVGGVGLECATTSSASWTTGNEVADLYLSADAQGQSAAYLVAGAAGAYSVSGTVSPTSSATTGRAIAFASSGGINYAQDVGRTRMRARR